MTQTIKGEQSRTFTIDLGERKVSEETRTVEAALSSEQPARQWFGVEVLVHEDAAINFERAASGLPMLWSHDHESPIGRIESIRLDADKVLRGQLRFSKNAKANEVWEDVKDGFLRDLSIGYSIDEYEEGDDDLVRVTKWTPHEASIVTVPADSRVGINRGKKVNTMTDEVTTDAAAESDDKQQDKLSAIAEMRLLKKEKDAERKKGALMESKRRSKIREIFDGFETRYGDDMTELRKRCEDNPLITPEDAKEEIFEAIREGYISTDAAAPQDVDSAYRGLPFESKAKVNASAGSDQMDKFKRGAELALTIRSGAVVSPEEQREAQQGEFLSMAPSELAREYLRINGERATGNRENVIAQALKFQPGFQRDAVSHGTGHFASILENVANKSMLDGFMQAEETWQTWVQQRSIPDFKQTSLVNLSLFNGLEQVRENGEYTYGDMSDIKETMQLATYGRLFAISRQALANDDLAALGDIPRAMGAAANYKIGDVVYAVLTTGTTTTMLQDSTALFHADHSNYVTSGAAPSVSTLNAGRTAMATQTDPQGKVIGVRPGYLITPIALQTTAETLIAAQYDPAGSAGTLTPNPFQNSMTVVADHRLDTANSSGWYLAAMRNTVVVGFLNGQSSPYLESKDGWTIDGVSYKVRIDAAATAADYRGLYYNDGVT